MNRKLLILGISGMLFALSSCNVNSDDDENYQTLTYRCCNLVIPSSGDSFAAADAYALTYYLYSGQLTVSSSALTLGNGTAPFATTMMPYTAQAYSNNLNQIFEVTKFSGGKANSNGIAVNNLSGFTSQIVNVLSTGDPIIPAYPFTAVPALVMSYNVNDSYTVKTFQPDAIYTGTTTINTQSDGTMFSNDGVRYRIVFHQDLKKADVIFYDAKFAQNMPVTITVILENLDVTYNKTGYVIRNSEPIIPLMYAQGASTPFPGYKFVDFTFMTSNDRLTTANINYTVARMTGDTETDRFMCMFNGYYVREGNNDQQ